MKIEHTEPRTAGQAPVGPAPGRPAPATNRLPEPGGPRIASVNVVTSPAPSTTALHGQPPAPKPPAKPPTTGVLGVLVRRTIALSLVVAAGWWILLSFFFPVSSQAVVNARLVQVRSPIDAMALELVHDIGDPVVEQPLAKLANRRVDTSHLARLQTALANATARRDRLQAELTVLTKQETTTRSAAEQYSRALLASLQAGMQEARARAEAARAEYDAATALYNRMKPLADNTQPGSVPVIPPMDLDKATAAVLVTRKNMEKEQAALVKAQGELQAAQQGLFVQKDAPFFQQKLMEMDLRIPQLQAELKEMLESIAAAEKEIEQEKGRVERMGQATASSPVTGVVWKRYGNPGQSVKQNETLYEIADSKTVFIEALLHQRFLNQIVPGCQATVNFTGGQTLTGKVRTVRTQMPSETEAAFAVNLADHDLKHVRVIIDFDPPVQDPSLIGRHCRVLIADERPTQVQQAVTWLFSNLRM